MQRLTFKLGTDEVEVVTAQIDISSDALETCAKTLSPVEINTARQFKFARDRIRYIFVHATLRELIGIRVGVAPNLIHFEYGEFGKPMLKTGLINSDFFFNLSHTKNHVVFAFSKSFEVGIDIEALSQTSDSHMIASQFFSLQEFNMYRALPQTAKTQGFLNCWTRKEAFIKALGLGLNYALDSFDVTLHPDEPAKILAIRNPIDSRRSWFMESFTPAPDHVGCIVSMQQ